MKKFDPVTILGSLVCIVALALIFAYNWTHTRRATQAPQPIPANPVVSQEATMAAPQDAPVVPGEPAALPPFVQREPVLLSLPELMEVQVDPMKGGVTKVTLANYHWQTGDRKGPRESVAMGREKVPFLSLNLPGRTLHEIAEPTIAQDSLTLHRATADSLLRVDESWKVDAQGQPNAYSLLYTLRFTNGSTQPVSLGRTAVSCGALPDFLAGDEGGSFASKYLSGCVAYGRAAKGDAKTLDMKAISRKLTPAKVAQYETTPANWVGVSSKYFLFALRNLTVDGSPAPFPGFAPRQPQELLPQEYFSAEALLPEVTLAPGESVTFTITGYSGPKSLQMLEPMGQGLPSILNMDLFFFWHFDWMGWLCKMLLKALNGIAGWFPPSCAYGLAIILITLLVKVVFMPLAWHSTRSMKKMSALQPQLKVLREKYKEDPQRMYYEQNKLFKENQVSQTGGCLPMLVQIPVFFAMFNTFRGAIEIRNASFLWVADLSMPDPVFGLPIHPLAILTGVTMLLQQKLQPMPDPSQARMMNIMSLVFVVFFYNMPAGLTLYMTVNQLTSIAQMLLFRRLEKRASLGKAPAKAGKPA